MQAQDIIDRAGRLLFDPTHVRWTIEELIDYIGDAQRQIVLRRPDAYSVTENLTLAAGTKQSLPAGTVQLLDVIRNMGPAGNTPGSVVYLTKRIVLDTEVPTWHTSSASSIKHYVYDPEDDRLTFYVYPGAVAGTVIEIQRSREPNAPTGASDALALADQFLNPVLNWTLYRCLSKDATYNGPQAYQKALTYEQTFYRQLGIDYQVIQYNNPAVENQGAPIRG